jgi:hypothetical protein
MTEKEFNKVIQKALSTPKARALRYDLEKAILAYGDYLAEASGVNCTVSVVPYGAPMENEGDAFVYQQVNRPVH